MSWITVSKRIVAVLTAISVLTGASYAEFIPEAGPTIVSVAPSAIYNWIAGREAYVSGTNFHNNVQVFVGETPVSFRVVSPQTLYFTIPQKPFGKYDFRVVDGIYTANLPLGLEYRLSNPRIDSVSSPYITTAGGENPDPTQRSRETTLHGRELDGTNFTVTIDGVTCKKGSTLEGRPQFYAPPHAEGWVDVETRNADGQTTKILKGLYYDGTPPSIPQNLRLVSVAPGRVTITWDASSDGAGSGVLDYIIYRDGIDQWLARSEKVGPTTYADLSVAPSQTYVYQVAAFDRAYLDSQKSAPLTVYTGLNLEWVSPGVGPAYGGQDVVLRGINFSQGATVLFGGVACSQVVVSSDGRTINAKTPAGSHKKVDVKVINPDQESTTLALAYQYDGLAPSVPTNLRATQVLSNKVVLAWNASTDDSSIYYKVFRDDVELHQISQTTYEDTAVSGEYKHNYFIKAVDAWGYLSAKSNAIAISKDLTPPSTPLNLQATLVSSNRVDLAWDASTDASGISAYRLYKNGVPIPALIAALNYSDINLNSNTRYDYQVSAIDIANLESVRSPILSVTTSAPDTSAPALSNVGITNLTPSSVEFVWQTNEPSTSQVDYGFSSNYGQTTILDSALVANHTVSLGGLSPNVTYHYRVRSADSLGNLALSEDLSFTTPSTADVTPPVISNVSATNIKGNSALINWVTNEASDSQIEYGLTPSLGMITASDRQSVFVHVASLSGLEVNRTYYYRARSKDAAGNVATSSTLSFTTAEVPDTTAPVISRIVADSVQPTAAVINWITDEASDSFVEYGITTALESAAPLNSQLTLNHAIQLSGLRATAYYYFRVRSKDNAGNVSTSLVQQFRTASEFPDATAPVISNISSGTPGPIYVGITWNTDDYADSQVEYGTTTNYEFATPRSIRFVRSHLGALERLIPNTVYHYRVRSMNDAGLVSVSGDFTFKTDIAPVGGGPLVGNVNAQNIAHDKADISWETHAAADSQIEYGFSTAYGNMTALDPELVFSHTVSLTNLTPSKLYHFKIKSRDMFGNYNEPVDYTFTTLAPPPDTVAPVLSLISVSTITPGSAQINWASNEPSDSVVEFGLSANYGSSTSLNSALVTSHIVPLSGLSEKTTYHFRVKSKDAAGNVATSGDQTFTTLAIPDTSAPTISAVTASTVTYNSAQINWATNENSDSQVEYGPTTAYGTLTPLNSQMVTAHVLPLNNLSASTLYHYRVKSKDAAGNIATSPDFTFSTVAAPDFSPPNITFVNVSTFTFNSAQIVWTTNEPSDSLVEWGLTTTYGFQTSLDPQLSTVHSVPLSGLSANTLYHYRVKSRDRSGNLAISNDYSFITAVAPDTTAPVISSVVASTITVKSAQINWTTHEPSDSQVEWGTTPSYGNVSSIYPQMLTAHSVVLSGLQQGTVYHYRVKSKDSSGNLAVSGNFTLTTLIPPDTTAPVISGVSTSGLSTNAVQINWVTNEVSDTQVEYGKTISYGSSSSLNSSMVNSHQVNLSGLTANTLYHYRVKSQDAAGNIAISPDFTFTTLTTDQTGPVISGINVTNVSNSAAQINWITDEASDSQVEYGPTLPYQFSTPVNSVMLTTHFLGLSGLSANTLYHYRVKSKDVSGNLSLSADLTFTTSSAADTTPPLMTGVNANNVTHNTAQVGWVTNEASDSQVEYGLSQSYGQTTSLNVQLVGIHVIDLAGLIPNTLYHYRVKSKDAAGNAATSGDFTFKTLVAPDVTGPVISALGASSITHNSAQINWTTDEASDSQVEYGTTSNFGNSTTLNAQLLMAHSVSLTGLSSNTLYYYRVKSKDGVGNLTVSQTQTFTSANPPDTTSPVIQSISISSVDSTSATIGWVTSEPTDEQVFYGPTTSYGASTSLNSSMKTTHVVTLVGLIPSTDYHFQIRVKDAAGNVALSPDQTLTTTSDVDKTSPVISQVKAVNIGFDRATIEWATDENSTSLVEYGPTSSYGDTTLLDANLVLTHSVVLENLEAQTQVHYRVVSMDFSGNTAFSHDFVFTTLARPVDADQTPPSIPQNLKDAVITRDQVVLTWAASTDNVGVQFYRLYKDGDILASNLTELEFSDMVVQPGTKYMYQVEAVDLSGNASGLSAPLEVLIPNDVVKDTDIFSDNVGFGKFVTTFNPQQGLNSILYTLTQPSPVKMVVYDVRGREVRVLLDELVSNPEPVSWDGKNSDGETVASDMYVLLLDVGGKIFKKKIVAIR